jgi:hypothetical protein
LSTHVAHKSQYTIRGTQKIGHLNNGCKQGVPEEIYLESVDADFPPLSNLPPVVDINNHGCCTIAHNRNALVLL